MIPRHLHLYWGRNRALSWMRYMTVWTFARLNPDWKITVWYPENASSRQSTWSTSEHKAYAWKGEDYFLRLKDVGENVSVEKAPMQDFPSLTDVHRSDLLRWRLLHTVGGFWSDFDIIYFKPMSALDIDYSADALLCWGEIDQLKHWQAIGFLAGAPESNLFKEMAKLGLALTRTPNLSYQDLGTELLLRFAKPGAQTAVGCRIGQIPQHSVYPFVSVESEMPALWRNYRMLDVKDYTVGLHWFAAQNLSCLEESRLTGLQDFKGMRLMSGIGQALQEAGFIEVPEDKVNTFDSGIKYSFIIPYIDRIVQFQNTLVSYKHWYGLRKDWEIILVIDPKCTRKELLLRQVSRYTKEGFVIRLVEAKSNGNVYNPSSAFNLGVSFARGQFVIITSPEVYHDTDVLSGLDEMFDDDPYVYAVCACRNRKTPKNPRLALQSITTHGELRGPLDAWFQHSEYRPAMYHFCSAMSRDLYNKIGGFDERFTAGYCFDDDDFRNNIQKADVEIVQLDYLLTYHQEHAGVKPANHMDLWRRNKALYEEKWGEYVHIEPKGELA